MPDSEVFLILIVILGITAVTVLIFVPLYFYLKHRKKKLKESSKFNLIRIGMSESELYAQYGTPHKTFCVDDSSKVVTFIEKKFSLLTCLTTGTEVMTAQVSIKDGIVTNLEITAES